MDLKSFFQKHKIFVVFVVVLAIVVAVVSQFELTPAQKDYVEFSERCKKQPDDADCKAYREAYGSGGN